MAGNPPIVTLNVLSADMVSPGGSIEWTVRAQDATARTFTVNRLVEDSQGNKAQITQTIVISDPIKYGPPMCDDPAVSFVPDATDPGVVHVVVAADA